MMVIIDYDGNRGSYVVIFGMYFEGRADRTTLWIVCWERGLGEMQYSRVTSRFLA